jgi:hypothetical protein
MSLAELLKGVEGKRERKMELATTSAEYGKPGTSLCAGDYETFKAISRI